GKLGGGTGVKRGGRGELESAVEARVGVVVDGQLAEARAEFYGLRLEDDLGVILKLVVVGGLADGACRTPASGEGSGDDHRGKHALGRLGERIVEELEARFVDDLGAENLRIADLQGVLLVQRVVGLRGQGETIGQSVVRQVIAKILVADAERIVGRDLEIKPGGDIDARFRKGYGAVAGLIQVAKSGA